MAAIIVFAVLVASLAAVGFAAAPPAHAADGTLSYVASASTAANQASHSVQIPNAAQAGDSLLLFMTTNDSTITLSTPSGWTLIESVDGNGVRGRAWARTATAGIVGTNVTVTASAAVKATLSVAAYRSSIGSPTISASESSVVNTSSSSHTTPSVDVAGANSWLVSYWGEKSSTTLTWTLPDGTTSRTSAAATGSGKVSSVLGDSNAAVGTGTAAGRTATTSAAASRAVMFSVVVQPGSDTSPSNGVPTASFTASCSGLTCSFDASGSTDPDNDPLTFSWNFGDGTTGTGVTASRTYATAGARTVTLTASDGEATDQTTRQVNPALPVGGPGHTVEVSDTVRTNLPRITAGEIFDLEYIGDRVYIVGGFTSIRNNAANNTTTYNQRYLAAFNLQTGLVDAGFRPTFDNTVSDVEASPDGTKLFIAGRFNTVNGVTKRKFASINPVTGATVAGFTAHGNGAGTELEATNTTVYLGGQFTQINGADKVGLAAVDANTGALLGRSGQNPRGTWNNDISGGIGPNGALNVQELKITPDQSKLLVVHTGRQIAGQDRYGVGLINLTSGQLLPWRTRLWEDNLPFVGGIQRIYAGDIAPNGEYFVVGSGSGGDRPPINDTAVAFSLEGGDFVEPLWVSRMFDSVYSIAISEVGIYVGGHMSWAESPTARDPWPGLDDQGYGTGQGLSGYGLGDDVLRRDHVAALSPSVGKAISWNPGSNSFEGNKAMLVHPRGLVTGGDATTQGDQNVGRIAAYNLLPTATAAYETTITSPIEGRVEEAGVQFTVEGTARVPTTTGVNRVQVEIRDRNSNRYLQDDLVTWGAGNTINATLASPGAATTNWSLPLTIQGNQNLQVYARAFANNGNSDQTKDVNKFETFSTSDRTPTASITGPSGVVPSTTFTVTGTATDDVGVQSIGYTVRDTATTRYLQDDGSASATYNSFSIEPDVPGGLSTTWSVELTVPYEGQWQMQVTPRDTAGQASLDTVDRTWIVSSSGIEPSVSITTPAVMNPPTAIAPLTVAPGGTMTFSGSATDDENLFGVEIQLRNSATREALASDGTWGVDVPSGWHRITPLNLNATSVNWSWTTPFTLRPGTYTFSVRAVDDVGLSTSSTNQGRLTINCQVAGDAPPNGLISPSGTVTGVQVLHLDLAGTATDDFGVAGVEVALEDNDTNRFLQPNGTMGAAFATLDAALGTMGGTSTTWTLPVDLPTEGDWSITVFAIDSSGQQDPSTTGATARYPIYPGDQPPTVVQNLLAPQEGAVFTDARILVSGRVEDDRQIAGAQVAIRNSAGQYMSSSGTFTSTTESWRNAFLNSPGSPGSNYSYTTPVIPAGAYVVRVRGVDHHGFTTNPTVDVNVTVEVPASNPPVANFTVSCTENICEFDARSSTDENPTALTYSWNFGNGTGSGAVVTRTYTAANTYTVTLTARDEWGYTGTATQTVTIVEPAGNQPPNAVISPPSCSALVCNFSSASSTDPNVGDTITRLWNWGDATPTSTLTSTSHTFPAPGTYTVTLTVTDGWGRATTVTREVTVTSP
jgi:large repetitive protein